MLSSLREAFCLCGNSFLQGPPVEDLQRLDSVQTLVGRVGSAGSPIPALPLLFLEEISFTNFSLSYFGITWVAALHVLVFSKYRSN